MVNVEKRKKFFGNKNNLKIKTKKQKPEKKILSERETWAKGKAR